MALKSIRPKAWEAIVDAAIQLLARNPGASMNEIAMVAGVGRATLYRHYSTRDELIAAIFEQSILETDQAVMSSINERMTAFEQLDAMLRAVIPLGDRYHFLATEFSTAEELHQKYQKELSWLADLVHQLRLERVVAQDVPIHWAVAQIDQIVWTAWREVGEGRVASADAPNLALRTFTRGLA